MVYLNSGKEIEMAKISYVNGRFVDHRKATVHVDDRGYLFSDGVYEVIAFYNRKLLDEALHLKRLQRSLKELEITAPMSISELKQIVRELLTRNSELHGSVYIQITRGVALRNHLFPQDARPSIMMTVNPPKFPKREEVQQGVKVVTMPDLRWGRRDIKSISLLPNVIAREQAHRAGAREAWLIGPDGYITEGSISNNFLVIGGRIVTHPADHDILGGITRDVVLRLARKAGMKVEEKPFTLKQIAKAEEAFLTSTTSNVLPVVKVDGRNIGSGRPGEVTKQLLALYRRHIKQQTGFDYDAA